jgi:hypothetical protein
MVQAAGQGRIGSWEFGVGSWELGVRSFVLRAVEGVEDFPGRFFVLPGLDFGIILLK